MLSEQRSAFGPWTPEEFFAATSYSDDIPLHVRWRLPSLDTRLFLAHDFGVAAPSVTFVCARSPGFEGPDGRFYPRDSLMLLDEFSSNGVNKRIIRRRFIINQFGFGRNKASRHRSTRINRSCLGSRRLCLPCWLRWSRV